MKKPKNVSNDSQGLNVFAMVANLWLDNHGLVRGLTNGQLRQICTPKFQEQKH